MPLTSSLFVHFYNNSAEEHGARGYIIREATIPKAWRVRSIASYNRNMKEFIGPSSCNEDARFYDFLPEQGMQMG